MTGAQAPYLKMLCAEFDPDLSKADASKRSDALRARATAAEPVRRSQCGAIRHTELRGTAARRTVWRACRRGSILGARVRP